MPTIDLQRIRSAPKSRNDSFEALAVQLFRAYCPASAGSDFRSLRGDGGDGGVEAFYRAPSNEVQGVQAKYFFKLGAAELNQIAASLQTALINHPTLTEYWVFIPFDLTGKVAGGSRGKSETERFDDWKKKAEDSLKNAGRRLDIVLCSASVIRDQLQRLDVHGGLRRYWFDDAILTQSHIQHCLEQAKAFAGPRFTDGLDVVTRAHEALDFFGGIGDFEAWRVRILAPLLMEARSLSGRCKEVFDVLPKNDCSTAVQLFKDVYAWSTRIRAEADVAALARTTRDLIARLKPYAAQARMLQEAAFAKKYGADKDTPSFRQFHAEYMCNFPAGPMDATRDTETLLASLDEVLMSPLVLASTTHSFLLVGPGGVGKTHALVSAAQRRLDRGAYSLVVFGDDFGATEPWEVLRSKLGFGADVGRGALFECLQACAENTGFPFVVAIDALNESPRTARWKDKLPELLEQCKQYPGIKVCVSVRDTYRGLVMDARFPGFAFRHCGFEGKSFEALQAFATYYGLDAEITPLFADELTNPLFLHLVCQTLKAQGRRSLDVSLPGFSALFESHLANCDKAVRSHLGYVNPRNVVRASMMALAEVLVGTEGERTWTKCVEALRSVVGSELSPESLLGELQHEGLAILSGNDDDGWVVRLGYQRYGDVLRSLRLIEVATDANGSVDLAKLGQRIRSLTDDDSGLLEMLAAVLPERTGVEITDASIGLEREQANRLFITSLPWRSRKSISSGIKDSIIDALQTPGLWPDVYEVFFKLCLVPDHRLNAGEWLNPFLWRQALPDRDAYLSHAAVKSFDENGAVKSLIDAALQADLSRWPDDSLWLAGIALGWLTSCSDRRVRDLATKGLARVFGQKPELAADMASAFDGCDDDYLLESVALATYAACLLDGGQLSKYIPALDALLMRGYDTPNVLVRDTVRLLARRLDRTGLPQEVKDRLIHYPTRVDAPKPWPTLTDAQPLLSLEHLPLNMKLWGDTLGPDFWRYKVEPCVKKFDLKREGVTLENTAAWVMVEALNLGYPGRNDCALIYDQALTREYGSGRARKGYAERLGKKYYWIALHRLLGVLADTVGGARSYSGFTPGPDYLWSVDVRKCDPTDVRDLAPHGAYPDEILQGPRYSFPPQSSNIKPWVRADDFTSHASCTVRVAEDGTEWVAISLSARDDDRDEEDDSWNTPYLTVRLDYSAVLASAKRLNGDFLSSLESAFDGGHASCYRSYLAEYPTCAVFEQRVEVGDLYLGPKDFRFAEVALMRGNEWEYDYSAMPKQESLHVPCQDIVRDLNLAWDKQRGWLEPSGHLAAFEAKAKQRTGLFIRRDLLNHFLATSGNALLYRRFANRGLIDQRGDDSSQLDISTFLRYEAQGIPTVLYEDRSPFNC